jgi:hypothetical protein
MQQNEAMRVAANTPAGGAAPAAASPGGAPTPGNLAPVETMVGTPNPNYTGPKSNFFDDTVSSIENWLSPSAIQEAGQADAIKAGNNAVAKLGANAPDFQKEFVFKRAFNAASPGILSTHGPMTAVGLGTMALAKGFSPKPLKETEFTQELKKSATDRIREGGTQRENYLQNLPGVVYDDKGEPVSGQYNPFPTFQGSASNYSTMMGQGSARLPSIYTPPPGSIGRSQNIMQPYNNADMYSNLMRPRGYFEGGIAGLADGGYPRRTGQISGPGTEKSDSIPAMLSDGEFVMTAAAVRGAGKGNRRAGAKQMYKLMHQLEKNAQRG